MHVVAIKLNQLIVYKLCMYYFKSVFVDIFLIM